VDQDVHFFDTTIKENLRYFAPNATDEEIIECCKKAGIHKEIMEKNKGYDEPMGQDGASLSGGQKQRIAIARAFLKKSPIIILDEPTSGLNKELSARIIGEIKQHAKDKTLIMVTHNPLEIASADRVIAVENGKIVEDGRPRDLIKKEKGYMRNLYNDEEDFRNQREYFAKLSGGATLEKNIAELQNIQRPTSVQLKQTRKVLSENPDVYVKLSKVRLKSHQQKKQKNGLTTKDSSFNNDNSKKNELVKLALDKKVSKRA
jgi:ABC-type multidrug transport system ATPase subunit